MDKFKSTSTTQLWEAQAYRRLSLPEKGHLSQLSNETRRGAEMHLLLVGGHARVACLESGDYGRDTIATK